MELKAKTPGRGRGEKINKLFSDIEWSKNVKRAGNVTE